MTATAESTAAQVHELVGAMNGISLQNGAATEQMGETAHSATVTLDAAELHKRCHVPVVYTEDGRVKHTFNLTDPVQARHLAQARWLDADALAQPMLARGQSWTDVYAHLDKCDAAWHAVRSGRDIAVLQHPMCVGGKLVPESARMWPLGVTGQWGVQLMKKNAGAAWRLYTAEFRFAHVATSKARSDAIMTTPAHQRDPQWRRVDNFTVTRDEPMLAHVCSTHAVLLAKSGTLWLLDRAHNAIETVSRSLEQAHRDGTKALALACDSHVIAVSLGARVLLTISRDGFGAPNDEIHYETVDLVDPASTAADPLTHAATALSFVDRGGGADHTLYIGTDRGVVCECLIDVATHTARAGRLTACYSSPESDLHMLQTHGRRFQHPGVEPIRTLVALAGVPRAEANEVSDCVQLIADTEHNSWLRIRHVFDYHTAKEYAGLPGERSTVIRRDASAAAHMHFCANVLMVHFAQTNTLLLLDFKSNRQLYQLQLESLFRDLKTDTPQYAPTTRRYQSVAVTPRYAVALMHNGDVFYVAPRDDVDKTLADSEASAGDAPLEQAMAASSESAATV